MKAPRHQLEKEGEGSILSRGRFVDDGTLDVFDALDNDVWQQHLQLFKNIVAAMCACMKSRRFIFVWECVRKRGCMCMGERACVWKSACMSDRACDGDNREYTINEP